MRFKSLDEWLSWQQELHPTKIDLGLDRIERVLQRLDLLPPPFRVITIAGTNGKGSSVAMLDAVLSAAGYRTGAFTSPHLFHYRERLRVAGHHPDDGCLMALFDRVDRARGDISLTYFEFCTAAALVHFRDQAVHVALLEVGLGGRLDAVNALDADGAVVVSVGVDHVRWLGADRESIGGEKAGIFRPGRPAIVSEPNPPDSVIAAAERLNAVLRVAGRDFEYQQLPNIWRFQGVAGAVDELPLPPLSGRFQLQNAAGGLALLEAVDHKLPVPKAALAEGIRQWWVPARLQRFVLDRVEWFFDVAHNPHAAEALAGALQDRPAEGQTTAVVGLMADKDHDSILAPLLCTVDHWVVAPAPTDRSAGAAEIEELLRNRGIGAVTSRPSVAAACSHARRHVGAGDRVVVFGSFRVVGPALQSLGLYSTPGQQ